MIFIDHEQHNGGYFALLCWSQYSFGASYVTVLELKPLQQKWVNFLAKYDLWSYS